MAAQSLVVGAPAKVNLTLGVLGRRPDGYHEVSSILQALTLADRIRLERIEGPAELVVRSGAAGIPAGEENLALRALRAMERCLDRPFPVRISLEKAIPVAAGLGGGSSDAAAVLWGINSLFSLALPPEELAAVAAGLGADVAFFLSGGTALARGIGEILTPLPFPGPWPVVLAKPDLAVSTAEVYRHFDPRAVSRHPDDTAMERALVAGDWAAVCQGLGNDLETVTLPRYPVVRALKERFLALGAAGVLMSGSGPTVFALARDREEAGRLVRGVDGLAEVALVTAFSLRGVGNLEVGGVRGIDALVLAGRANTGAFREISPVPWEALVEIAGRPMLAYVLEALGQAQGIGRVVVVGPREALETILAADPAPAVPGLEIQVVERGENLTENLRRGLAALADGGRRVLVVSSDLPLITGAMIDAFLAACREAPAAFHYPILRREDCLARYPGARRTFVTLREGTFTGGNLFLLEARLADKLLALVERFHAARKSPLRLAGLLGWGVVLKFLLKRASVRELEQVFTRLAGATGRSVICAHPEIGMDVDKPEDLALAEARLGPGGGGGG